ncbi:MAG: SpoIIE family protein phosphatase [Chloroflexota bacterium]|nr:SpoIIE family protein phosphatase [Chloroflexota bacterium]
MPTFQILSRTARPSGPLKKPPTRARRWWDALVWQLVAGLIIATFATLLLIAGLSLWFFLLLPTCTSIVTTRYQSAKLIHGSLLYAVLTIGLTLIYFVCISAIEFFIHTPGFGLLYRYHGPPVSLLILVTTTLAWSVILAPLRIRIQEFIDQRFNRRDYKVTRAIEAFNSTLREEINLDQLCERLFTVLQETMQPLVTSLWVRKVERYDLGHLPAHANGTENSRQVRAQSEEHAQLPQESPVNIVSLTEPAEISVADSDPFMAYVLSAPGAVEVERLPLDSPMLQGVKTMDASIVLPLASQGELIGLLTLGPRPNGERYAHKDRTLLNTLAAQVAPALRVTQMVHEQQTQALERERIEQELRTAQDIQRTFLPKDVPVFLGWQIAPYYQPAREVGGDFYDFLVFGDGRLGLVIGDVTDKGIPAALVMTATRTMLRTAAQAQAAPGEVFARVNNLLHADIPSGMFVTCFYAILDTHSGHLHYANAGHEPPYYRQATGASELCGTGMPLGMLPGTRYDEYEVTLAPGESLLFYSDGLVEAHNGKRDMFGFPRLLAFIGAHPGGPGLLDPLLAELAAFTGNDWEQEDDVTLVALHRDATRVHPIP